MNESDKLIALVKKDWETVPGISKLTVLVSLVVSMYVLSAWQTEASKGWFIALTVLFNVTLLVFWKYARPYLLRRKYSASRFAKGMVEVVVDGNIWFIVDHRKKQIRWIANMLTAIELGFRNFDRYTLQKQESMVDYLRIKKKKSEEYKAVRRLLVAGRPGQGIGIEE